MLRSNFWSFAIAGEVNIKMLVVVMLINLFSR